MMGENARNINPDVRQRQSMAGSQACEPAFVVVGKIRRPHGVKGEILMEVHTDFPERLISGKIVFVGDIYREHIFASTRQHALGMIVKIQGIDDPETAGELRNQMVYVKTGDLPQLPEGEFYLHMIIGFRVVDETGNLLGILQEILETGANDVYLVKAEQSQEELLLPAIESVILDVNLEKREILVRLPEWY